MQKEWVKLFLSFIEKCGWQLVILFLAVYYKKEITRLFLQLGSRISKVKYNDFSIEFENEVRKLSEDNKKGKSKQEFMNDSTYIEYLLNCPAMAIIYSWNELEIKLSSIQLEEKDISSKIHKLVEMNILSVQQEFLVKNLKNLRTRLVHVGPIYISVDTANEYRKLCFDIIDTISANYKVEN